MYRYRQSPLAAIYFSQLDKANQALASGRKDIAAEAMKAMDGAFDMMTQTLRNKVIAKLEKLAADKPSFVANGKLIEIASQAE